MGSTPREARGHCKPHQRVPVLTSSQASSTRGIIAAVLVAVVLLGTPGGIIGLLGSSQQQASCGLIGIPAALGELAAVTAAVIIAAAAGVMAINLASCGFRSRNNRSRKNSCNRSRICRDSNSNRSSRNRSCSGSRGSHGNTGTVAEATEAVVLVIVRQPSSNRSTRTRRDGIATMRLQKGRWM